MVLILMILLQIFICVMFITCTIFSVNTVHKHYTRNDHNDHINNLSSLDRQNFIYHCILFGIIHLQNKDVPRIGKSRIPIFPVGFSLE